MHYRTILLALLLGLSLACSRSAGVNTNRLDKLTPIATPIQELAIPSSWRSFEVGPFRLTGPPDLKKRNVRGIDSTVYEYENREFSVGIEIGMYSVERTVHSFEYETGSIMIDARQVKFIKSDLNKPAANAARNADGSKSKPVEKNLYIEILIPEESALINVNYKQESSTPLAMAILQSIRLTKPTTKE